MANEFSAALGRAFNGGLTGACNGAVGSIFASASAAAAGGALSVIGASAIAGGCMGVAALPLIEYTYEAAKAAAQDPASPQGLTGALYTLTIAEIGLAIYLGCELGAAAVGVAASPVLTCYLTGSAVLFASGLAIGLICVIAAVAVGVNLIFNDGSSARPHFLTSCDALFG